MKEKVIARGFRDDSSIFWDLIDSGVINERE
jgi:hypothetical protein